MENPWERRCSARRLSRSFAPGRKCVSPSISIINFFSTQRKSTMYLPRGACLRNFRLRNCLFRSFCQSTRSPGVCRLRSDCAKRIDLFGVWIILRSIAREYNTMLIPSPLPPPPREREKDQDCKFPIAASGLVRVLQSFPSLWEGVKRTKIVNSQ